MNQINVSFHQGTWSVQKNMSDMNWLLHKGELDMRNVHDHTLVFAFDSTNYYYTIVFPLC